MHTEFFNTQQVLDKEAFASSRRAHTQQKCAHDNYSHTASIHRQYFFHSKLFTTEQGSVQGSFCTQQMLAHRRFTDSNHYTEMSCRQKKPLCCKINACTWATLAIYIWCAVRAHQDPFWPALAGRPACWRQLKTFVWIYLFQPFRWSLPQRGGELGW